MKRPLFAGLMIASVALLGGSAWAAGRNQDPRRPFRIAIHHADPWVVKALIEGLPVRGPEASTIPGFGGFLARGANAAMGLLKDGFLVVNPTDNSLWYYPNTLSANRLPSFGRM